MAYMAECLAEAVKAQVRRYRQAGERVPGLVREFAALGGSLKVLAESHAVSVFRVREILKTFIDEVSLQALQVYGACPLADNAYLGYRPESDQARSARISEEQTLAVELESFPDRFVRFLVRSNFLTQTQCERQIQACVHLLENIERVTNYEPLGHIKDAFAEISVAVMVAQMSTRLSPRHRATLHVHRILQADNGGVAPPPADDESEMED